MNRIRTIGIAAFVLAVALAAAAGASGSANHTSETGTLQLDAAFSPRWQFGDYCAPGTPPTVRCVRFIGEADVPGLGHATETYVKTTETSSCLEVEQLRTAVITVKGKGELYLSVPGPVCTPYAPWTVGPIDATITGGSKTYVGASGNVQFRSSVYVGNPGCGPCGRARDTWTGTLTVPGVDFDVTAPTLIGATSKSVRAPKKPKRVRVRFAVTASDATDGSVPVACTPPSGSFFSLGRTTVACSATDSSGNTGHAQFTVIVRRPRA